MPRPGWRGSRRTPDGGGSCRAPDDEEAAAGDDAYFRSRPDTPFARPRSFRFLSTVRGLSAGRRDNFRFFASFQAFFGVFEDSGLHFPETRLYYFLIILPVGVMVAQVILVHLV